MPFIADVNVPVSAGPSEAGIVGDGLTAGEGDEDGAVDAANGEGEGEGEGEAGTVGAADVQEDNVTATTKAANAVGMSRAYLFMGSSAAREDARRHTVMWVETLAGNGLHATQN